MTDLRLLKAEEVADRLSLSRARVYELLASGEIFSVKIGKSRRVPAAALVAFIERLQAEQTPA